MIRLSIVMSATLLLTACGDPLRNVTRLSDLEGVQQTDSVLVAAQTEEPETGEGFLGRLLGRGDAAASEPATQPDATVQTDPNAAPDHQMSDVDAVIADVVAQSEPQPAPRRGLGALFGRRTANERPNSEVVPAAMAAPEAAEGNIDPANAQAPEAAPEVEPENTPEVAPEIVPNAEPERAAQRPRFGLFGRRNAAPVATGPDARIVEVGTLLPYGEIARVCDISRRQLGTKVDQINGQDLYDTIPNSTAQRTFYVTGFPDNCARQFTGALVLTGDVGTHEVVRYAAHNDGLAYSATDSAYEAIKAQFCRVPHGEPCGSRLERLGSLTTFLTVYDSFGAGDDWIEILIHDGAVVAIGPKG
ncbi:hypothetical protein [Aestuariibius sp. HNIBRBA575]|uniref:hypothetical protein n=1 Tax=Aestuariibius sp. HNIBRBA575 TaxID=3233343 RepID=UPI0034A214DB